MKLRLRTTFPGASHRLRARTPGLRALTISSVQNSVTGTPCPRVASGENGYHGIVFHYFLCGSQSSGIV